MNNLRREKLLAKYYDDPARCLECNLIIQVRKNQKPSEVKNKKFCDSSCASTYNNKVRILKPKQPKIPIIRKCANCSMDIQIDPVANGRYSKQTKCYKCKGSRLEDTTKGELFGKRKHYQSARSTIRNHAYKIFYDNISLKKYAVCDYTTHLEVAHIKAVSEFSDSTLISEINSPSNLIGLCPTHHWEYDNGLCKLPN